MQSASRNCFVQRQMTAPALNLADIVCQNNDEQMLNGGFTSEIPSRARLMSLQSDGKLNADNTRIIEEDDSNSSLITK